MRTVFFLLLPIAVYASDPRSVNENRQGIKAIEKKEMSTAENKFLEALEHEPEDARLHMNLGLAFQARKDHERAFKEYQAALKFAKDPALRFYANFNSAQALGTKNVDLALRFYQEALNINLDSKETKHNIELLMQQQSGGGGDGKDQQNKDDKNQDQGQDRTNDPNKNEPQPYKGKDLSQQDVQNILEELKNQEQKVRAKENNAGRERNLDKDW